MRDYYPKQSEIPRDIYEQVRGIIRGYDRLINDRYILQHGTAQKAEGGRPSSPGAPTEDKAIRLAYLNDRIHAIDQAQMWMRGKLDGAVDYGFDPIRAFWDYNYYNAQHRRVKQNDNGPAPRTWKRYRIRFAAIVARNLKLF